MRSVNFLAWLLGRLRLSLLFRLVLLVLFFSSTHAQRHCELRLIVGICCLLQYSQELWVLFSQGTAGVVIAVFDIWVSTLGE